MCIIRTFLILDPKGILLDLISRPIRRYLKERKDTARIVITSMLAYGSMVEIKKTIISGSELSVEIALEMNPEKGPLVSFQDDADKELDFNDPKWQPAPMDAAPNYKQSTHDTLKPFLTLWDRDDFIEELKNILGDHLIRSQDPRYEHEVRLLELIKLRIGEDKMQACEVMLRDLIESRTVDSTIRRQIVESRAPHVGDAGALPQTPQPRRGDQTSALAPEPLTSSSRAQSNATLNAHIISSFFWPDLRDDHFLIPAELQAMQRQYESRFEHLKRNRKLKWKNALGDGTVTLELDDRTERFEGLTPWQVSVIYAFQTQPGEERVAKDKGKPKELGITRNVEQLEEMLQMDEQLVRQALTFWQGKLILRRTADDTFAVIERANTTTKDEEAAAAAQEVAEVQAQAQAGAVKSHNDVLQEKKDVYMTFITSMLTNGGKMPVARILSMMKVMVAGGFPFGPPEVTTLLEELKENGKVESLGGGLWGIKK
jgi:anaphase-promoting complex subunit 2